MLTYEEITAVTQSFPVLIVEIIIWLFPLIIYLIIAGTRKSRTSSGVRLSHSMLSLRNLNGWIAFFVWFILQSILFLFFLIFPFWAKLF